MPMNELEGKLALITGAGRGLGEATAKTLARAGCRVAVADINETMAARVAEQIRAERGRAWPVRLDVTDPQQVSKVFDSLEAAEGPLDVLINNAAVDVTVSLSELSVADWDRILRTNLTGPFLMAKNAFPRMQRHQSGHIINIASTAAKRAWANASAYHASKWGLLGFSHALHVEARPHNVRVTAVICGGMKTPFLLDRFADIDVSTLQDPYAVAETIRFVLTAPTVIPEVMALPLRETSWP